MRREPGATGGPSDAHRNTGRWSVEDAADAIGGDVRHVHPFDATSELRCGAVQSALGPASNDARDVQPGGLFVALAGMRTHGIHYAEQAAERGAAAVLAGLDAPVELVERAAELLPVIVAPDDGVAALGRLATAWRRRLGFTVVAITGSAGKTTTKDIVAGLMSTRGRVVASPVNNNNEIGLPITMLGADVTTDVVVCEMGMRGLGQIEYLCGIATPDVGVVTNAGPAHVELLGSVENVVRAKAELVAGVVEGGTAVVPALQPELVERAGRVPAIVVRFAPIGQGVGDCIVRELHRAHGGIAGALEWRGRRIAFELPVHGGHNATNLAAAVCAFIAAGGDVGEVADAMRLVRVSGGRGDRYRVAGGGLLIDDTYNANPLSMRVALEELAATPARYRIAVLGRMAELGAESARHHAELGRLAAGAGIDVLMVVGTDDDARAIADAYDAAASRDAVRVADIEAAAEELGAAMHPSSAVLLKASRSVGLDVLVQECIDEREEIGA